MPRPLHKLTPDSLTFESYRHSQGGNIPQLAIFRYMWLKYGVRPNLEPDEVAVRKYVKYLNGGIATGSNTHILPPRPDNPHADVLESFDLIQHYRSDGEARVIERLCLEGVTRRLLELLADIEVKILGLNEQWTSETVPGLVGTRPERQAARVRSGRASFLHYHGRDKRSTGYDAFDEMYGDLWGISGQRRFRTQMADLEEAIARSEMEHLGHYCLTREDYVVSASRGSSNGV